MIQEGNCFYNLQFTTYLKKKRMCELKFTHPFFYANFFFVLAFLLPAVFQNRRKVFFLKTIWTFRKTGSVIPVKFRFASGVFMGFFLRKRPTRPPSRGVCGFCPAKSGLPACISMLVFQIWRKVFFLKTIWAFRKTVVCRGSSIRPSFRFSFPFSQAAAG